MIFLISLIILLTIIAFSTLIYNIINRKRRIVINHSKLIKELNSLNDIFKLKFYYDISNKYNKTYYCNSKQKFDRYDTDKYFFDVLYGDIEYYNNILNHIIQNQMHLLQYIEKYNKLKSITTEECKQLKVSYNFYRKTENKYLIKHKLNPVVDTCMKCRVEYTSPQGRNHYYKQSIYGFDEIKDTLKKAKLQIEYDNSKEARKQFERNKLTKAIRYDVLRRDNFKCVLCGKTSQDGSMLHVDHIIPIAKGGTTELSNLRTLCSDCNLGKGTKE